MTINTLGIDLAKSSFQLHGVDEKGRPILRKKLSREKFRQFVADLKPCTVVMEAGSSSNYWGRVFQGHGHVVQLISPQHVKPFVKSQKNDRNDAEAIVEAASRPTMRFVPVKQPWQQEIQVLHRVRTRLVHQKTAITNEMRGILAEFGVVCACGDAGLRRQIRLAIEESKNGLSARIRETLDRLWGEVIAISEQIKFYTKQIDKDIARE